MKNKKPHFYNCINCGNRFESIKTLKKCYCGYDHLTDLSDQEYEHEKTKGEKYGFSSFPWSHALSDL